MSRDRFQSLARVAWLPFALAVILFIAYLVANNLLGSEYERIATNMFVLVVVVVGLQIFSGNSGVLSFGHVAFMAIGAYVSALLTIPAELKAATFTEMPSFLHWILSTNVGFVPAVLIGGICAAIFAILAAPPIVRLAGVPAGIATLALLVIVYTFTIQTNSITRGTSTMIGVPESTTMTNAFIWSILAVIVAVIYQGIRAGMRLRASRENFSAARSVGVRPAWDRSLAWVMSGFVAGVGGGLYGHYIVAFSAEDFYFTMTFTIVLMLVLGGMTSVSGAVVGVIFVTVLEEVLRKVETGPLNSSLPGFSQLCMAIALILVLILRPRGLTGGHEIPWPGDWKGPGGMLRRLRGGRDVPAAQKEGAIGKGAPPQVAPPPPAAES